MGEDGRIFRRKAGIEGRAVDRALVLMDAGEQHYFGVNRVGARIWQLLEKPQSSAELVRALTGEFAVDEAACRRETEAFLRQLLAKGLVVAAVA